MVRGAIRRLIRYPHLFRLSVWRIPIPVQSKMPPVSGEFIRKRSFSVFFLPVGHAFLNLESGAGVIVLCRRARI